MKKKLVITIEGDLTSDLVYALDEIKKNVEHGCITGSDSNDTGEYFFNIREVS